MIDASKGFVKDGNKNRLREQDIRKIVDVFNKQIEIPKYSRMVSIEEIENNEYNLNIPRYIDNQEEEDLQDIAAHLLGGIPNQDLDNLQRYWDVYPSLRKALFKDSDREGYSVLNVPKDEIKETIFNHDEFIEYSAEINKIIEEWIERYKVKFQSINAETVPKTLIFEISEDILNSFAKRTLIDKYDIYQHLMTYWLEVMKDDVYMIRENGWIADKDLVPEELVIEKFFAQEKEEIEKLEAEKDEITREKEEFEEEYSGEEGVLEELKNDKGNITKGSVNNRIKEIKNDPDSKEELNILESYQDLIDKEADVNKKVRDTIKKMDKLVNEKYKVLTEAEIKELVVELKWIPYIVGEVNGEMDRISHRLTLRIKELADRYEDTLGQLEEEVQEYSIKVEEHLKRMGFAW